MLVVEQHAISYQEVDAGMVFEGQEDPNGFRISILNNILVKTHVALLAQVM